MKLPPEHRVFVKKGRTKLLGFGKVTSEYIFDPDRPSHQQIRKVHWLKKGEFNLPIGVALSVKTLTLLSDADLLGSVKAAVGLTKEICYKPKRRHRCDL